MQKIGEGYYYEVYDLGNKRVVKKETSYKNKYQKLRVWYGHNRLKFYKALLRIKFDKDRSIKDSRVLSSIPEFKAVLGNPRFINKYEYEQDRAIPLHDVLNSITEDQFILFIREYIRIVFRLWAAGYGDQVYNFTLNTGISEAINNLILIDFNEFTSKKDKIIQDILKQKWLTQSSMKTMESTHPTLLKLTAQLFNSHFTIEELDKRWKKLK